MKFFLLLSLLSLSAALQGQTLGPLWHGPQPAVSWQGMDAPAAAPAAPVVPSVTPDAATDELPRWIGYVKRNRNDWYFRLLLKDGRSEMVKRGGSTSDGWFISDFDAQANRPTSVTLKRGDVEKTINLTPQ